MTRRGYSFVPEGDLVACPRCHSACRIGSKFHTDNEGQCPKCKEAMIASTVPPSKPPEKKRRRRIG